jgi:transcriptional regulator with XRE-family HTH domain
MAAHAELSFAGLLRRLRTRALLTQEELAEAAGLSSRSVSDLERGINRTARKDTAALLADALRLASPARELFVAAARGRTPAAEVLAAMPGAGNAGAAAAITMPAQPRSRTGSPAAEAPLAPGATGQPGWPLEEVTDPFALEVHRAVQPDNALPGLPGLPELPEYVSREHDAQLGWVVRAAVDGRSGIAALVGGSSTGKTRACWEALGLLRDQPETWRLWHPISPSRPEAALRELPAIGPWTVVWLNEAQFYLRVSDDGLGERVAAGLREVLRDPARAPVLVLATLWPQSWDVLTARPVLGADPHPHARELLAGRDITVPAAFTHDQLDRLAQSRDARLTLAATAARDGQVIQFLAGAPELMARYRNAPPAAAGLIEAAMDASRLGAGISLPRAFLGAAVPWYLTGAEWDALGEDWLEQALAYAAVPCKGASGPLSRVRPRPVPPGAHADSEPLYRLADYLDQHGHAHRKNKIPPAGFWAAAAAHACAADQAALGHAAAARGLYRAAAQLCKNAAAAGNLGAAIYLCQQPVLRADARAQSWAVTQAALDDPFGVARLLKGLREAGAHEQVTALLRRDPAASVALDRHGVDSLLNELRDAGASDQVTALLRRDPAASAPLDNPMSVIFTLDALAAAEALEQITVLADRAAAHIPLDNPYDVDGLIVSLRERGALEQATALADRAAAHVALDDAGAVAFLLEGMRERGELEQVAALVRRDLAERVVFADAGGVAFLLDELREAEARDQVTALLRGDPAARVVLDDRRGVAWLVENLREAGAFEQAEALADRADAYIPFDSSNAMANLFELLRRDDAREKAAALVRRDPAARVPLDDPAGVARLLNELRQAGAHDQVAALLRRDPAARAALDRRGGYGASHLLTELWLADGHEQLTRLTERLPAAGLFELFMRQDSQDRFTFGREADGRPAPPWGWDDLF